MARIRRQGEQLCAYWVALRHSGPGEGGEKRASVGDRMTVVHTDGKEQTSPNFLAAAEYGKGKPAAGILEVCSAFV